MKDKNREIFAEVTEAFRAPKKIVKSLTAARKATRGKGMIPCLILEDRDQKIKAVVFFNSDVKKITRTIDEVERRFHEFVISQLLEKR